MSSNSPDKLSHFLEILGRLRRDDTLSPKVEVILTLTLGHALGVQVNFNESAQVPLLLSESARSCRLLDRLLLEILEEEGEWDEELLLWRIESESGLDRVLGMLSEYSEIRSASGAPLRVAREPVTAKLKLTWLKHGASLTPIWLLPMEAREVSRRLELTSRANWTVIDGTLYRLSAIAMETAKFCSQGDSVFITHNQLQPLFEALLGGPSVPQWFEITNPEDQPATEIVVPVPRLSLYFDPARRDSGGWEVSGLTVLACLEFDYPRASGKAIPLPDRSAESAFINHLRSLGFTGSQNALRVSGDSAVKIIAEGEAHFPKCWSISGLDEIRRATRFAELSLSLSVESCKSGRAAFDCRIALMQNNALIPISALFKRERGGNDRWLYLDNGALARVPGGGKSELARLLGTIDPNFRQASEIHAELTAAQALSLSLLVERDRRDQLNSELTKLTRTLENFSGIERVEPPQGFFGKLRKYQEEGLSWLCFLNSLGLGGILADEMGLGKTVQALALLQHLKESSGSGCLPALVVAPTSVVTNWLYEARRFTPDLRLLLLHGPRRKERFGEIPEHDLVITSYALLRLDRFELEKHEFSYLILDEAQNIKNPLASTTRAAKRLRARWKLALTGTPTENRPLELWSLFDVVSPAYLGSQDHFRATVEKPILEEGPESPAMVSLRERTRPFVLRRTKAEVEPDLPPKIEAQQIVEMTDSQRELYAAVLEEVRPRVLAAVEEKGLRGASVSILAALIRLRQVCNHPNSIGALRHVPGYDSGKFELLKSLTEEAVAAGRKILLFSQFRAMLSIIRGWLKRQGIRYLQLDGTTKDRQPLIDQFNADPEIDLFLISLKAGGTGLNLTAADTVIIYDPWWNPAVEDQAIDRAHRIGQQKTVNVYRLITENSVEQRIMDLKERKAAMTEALIGERGFSPLNLNREDLVQLFA